MKSVALVIEGAQESNSPSAPGAVVRIIRLLRELDAETDLKLHIASNFF